mmetsp:Transcript_4709/g.11061  ORF Transcript_4709/g.11061 Transcript_4709/m.11061 type:complete len:530 (+) Transcript_4709:72-1661(+)
MRSRHLFCLPFLRFVPVAPTGRDRQHFVIVENSILPQPTLQATAAAEALHRYNRPKLPPTEQTPVEQPHFPGLAFLVVDQATFSERPWEIKLRAEDDPFATAETFCALSNIDDPQCRRATYEIISKHDVAFNVSKGPSSPVACEISMHSSNALENSDIDPVETWLEAAILWNHTSGPPNETHFNPARPYDGRMEWAAESHRRVFQPNPRPRESTGGQDAGSMLRRLAKIALAPWSETGIPHASVQAALRSDPPACALFEVGQDGHWYVSRACGHDDRGNDGSMSAGNDGQTSSVVPPTRANEEPWWRVRRRNAALEMIIDASEVLKGRGEPLPAGLAIAVCVGDCVGTASHQHKMPWRYSLPRGDLTGKAGSELPGPPIFSLIACAGSENIPFPVFMNRSHPLADSLSNWDQFKIEVERLATRQPFAQRKKQAVWRGGTHGKSCWDGTLNSTIGIQNASGARSWCGRRKLRMVTAAAETRHLFDVKYDYRSFESQMGYQAVIYAEGHCGWADRGKNLMLAGSILLWQGI